MTFKLYGAEPRPKPRPGSGWVKGELRVKPPAGAGGSKRAHAAGRAARAQGASPQPSTFTDTVETRWALGARTLSRPSR